MARTTRRPAEVARATNNSKSSEDAVARMRHAPEPGQVHVQYEGEAGGRVWLTPLVAKVAVERGEAKYLD